MIETLLIILGIAAVLMLVKWLQRCPRCKSLSGPKGLSGSLLPNHRFKVKRMCRRCGHAWEEEAEYDTVP